VRQKLSISFLQEDEMLAFCSFKKTLFRVFFLKQAGNSKQFFGVKPAGLACGVFQQLFVEGRQPKKPIQACNKLKYIKL